MDQKLYDELNKGWKSTCRIVLGEEIGELKEYDEWLKEYLPATKKRTSHISGKNVSLSIDEYCEKTRFVSMEEMKEIAVPIDINKLKDIDSIIEAVSEKWECTGNRIIGNSSHVENSDNVADSHYVADSLDITKSSYVYASTLVWPGCKYTFGSTSGADKEFTIRELRGDNIKRAFETHLVGDSSDVFLSAYCTGCQDIMFTFNQKNKRHMIGNLELPKDKYAELKKKLLFEIREELKKDKKFPSVLQLVKKVSPDTSLKLNAKPLYAEGDPKPIEKAFQSTFNVIFKRQASDLPSYKEWLVRHMSLAKALKSPFGATTYISSTSDVAAYSLLPEGRVVSESEAFELGKQHLNEDEVTSLDNVLKALPKIFYITIEYHGGQNSNLVKTPTTYNASNSYDCNRIGMSDYTGISSTTIRCKYVFGCYRITDTQFSISCYNSNDINRCFEVDFCKNCSDVMFAHNCEGLSEAMFCFNTKSKRYAIGNAQLPSDQYRKLKDQLVSQMADEIVKTKSFRYDVFNIGCGRQ